MKKRATSATAKQGVEVRGTTFTFRIPGPMVGRLSSAEMRIWLTQFLRNPSLLPADPGPGSERISLTLPKESVRDVAGYLRCSPSIALRRIAAAYLKVPAARKPAISCHSPSPRPMAAPRSTHFSYQGEPGHDKSAAKAAGTETAGSLWIPISIGALIIGALIFFGTGQIGIPESA